MLDKMIVLIGMPGCGKTTIGRILARELDVPFVDTDNLIREAEGMPLDKIQREKGMAYFLRAEEQALFSLDDTPKVVATGGSAIFCEHGMIYLGSIATVVYLETDLKMLVRRMGDPKKRGVVLAPNQTIVGVFRERRPLYQRYADIKIRTYYTRPKDVVERILSAIEPERKINKEKPEGESPEGERKDGVADPGKKGAEHAESREENSKK